MPNLFEHFRDAAYLQELKIAQTDEGLARRPKGKSTKQVQKEFYLHFASDEDMKDKMHFCVGICAFLSLIFALSEKGPELDD